MFKHAPRNAAIAFGLAAAALAGTAGPSFAYDPCDGNNPPDYCNEIPDPDVNHPPGVTIKANKAQVVRGETVHFTGTATDYEDGTPAFAYDVNKDDTFDDFAGQFEFDHKFTTLGDKVVRIRATDEAGETATQQVTVKVVNQAPTVKFDGPRQLFTGETADYDAIAADPDGDAVTVLWGQGTCKNIVDGSEGTGLSKRISAPLFPTETLPLCAVAVDAHGARSGREQIYIKVDNRKPTAAISYLPAKPVAGDTVTFDSKDSSDLHGSIASRAWDTNGDGKFDDGTGVTAQRAFATAGTYKAALKVVDDMGAESVKEITVAVAAKPADSKPVDDKPVDQKPVDTTKPADQTKPADTTKPADQTTKPADQVQVLPDVKAGPAANASTLQAKLTRKGKVKTLKVKGAKGSIAVACKGKGCAFKTKSTTNANLKSLFRKALRKGATITVVTGDGTTTAKRTFTVKVGKAGKAKVAIA